MKIDPLVAAIREARHRISAEFNHDPRRLVAYYRERERQLRAEGKYRFVAGPLRREAPDEDLTLGDKPSQS
jgi:hypothetical protein